MAAYPARFFTNLLVNGITVAVYFLIWRAIYQNQTQLAGFTFDSIITYYTLTYVIRELTVSGRAAKFIGENIRSGDLANYLIKPISFNIYNFTKLLTTKTLRTVVPGFLLATLVITSDIFEPPANPALFAISLVLATIIGYFVYALIGLIAFWTINVWGIISIYGRLVDTLNGSVFPLDFLPPLALTVTKYMPFRYMHYLPLSIYTGKITSQESLGQIEIQVIWVTALYLAYRLFWRKGVRQFDAVGN